MFKSFSPLDKLAQVEKLPQQVLKVLSGKDSNVATIKFISQLQLGKSFDAVFVKNLPEGKGVLSLKGHKVIVELPKELSNNGQNETKSLPEKLSKGQKLIVRVETAGPKPALKIIPSNKNSFKSGAVTTSLTSRGKSISRLTSLDTPPPLPNGITTARIANILDSKSILVETGSQKYVVSVNKAEGYKPGSQVNIYFEKTENGQKPVLMEAGAPKKLDFNTLKSYLPARMPIGEMAYLLKNKILDSPVVPDLKIKSDLLLRLQNTLRLFLPGEGETPSAEKIRQQVESSGINYEARVRQVLEAPSGLARKELASDLKGLLLELYHSTEQAPLKSAQKSASPLTEFRNSIKYAIDNIELNQLSSQVSKQENQPLVIQIPNPLSSGNRTIQLFVRDDSSDSSEGDKDSQKKHNVAFFLDLSQLGNIKINAQMSPESLSVSINVENEDVASFIQDRKNNFEELMSEEKIETSVECYVTHKVKPEVDGLIDLLVNQNTSLINIKT
jgi:hypothetical protein